MNTSYLLYKENIVKLKSIEWPENYPNTIQSNMYGMDWDGMRKTGYHVQLRNLKLLLELTGKGFRKNCSQV